MDVALSTDDIFQKFKGVQTDVRLWSCLYSCISCAFFQSLILARFARGIPQSLRLMTGVSLLGTIWALSFNRSAWLASVLWCCDEQWWTWSLYSSAFCSACSGIWRLLPCFATETLYDRLEKRHYPESKVKQNVEVGKTWKNNWSCASCSVSGWLRVGKKHYLHQHEMYIIDILPADNRTGLAKFMHPLHGLLNFTGRDFPKLSRRSTRGALLLSDSITRWFHPFRAA